MDAKSRTLALYKKSGVKRIFSYIRFWDAPLVELERLVPKKGIITELGCGDGILSNFLALSSPEREVIGIEIDSERLKAADRGLKNAKYIFGDIRRKEIPASDAIIISHVLHHLSSYEEQEEIIRACRKKLKKNGVLIILEIYVTASPKYALGWFFDHFLVPIFFEGRFYSGIYYRKRSEWEELLKLLGFKVKSINLTKGKPISNIAIICK